MFTETASGSANVWINGIRRILAFIDRPAYGLLDIVYQLFFNVSSATLFSGSTVAKFYGRIQMILGVYMMFQLALIILRGIVNPETFTDKKTGFSNFITRVITALVLLTMLIPINVPKSADNMNEFEKQINNNGLLFGTLYSLQYRLLKSNTIAKIILGPAAAKDYELGDDDGNSEDSKGAENLLSASKSFTKEIVKSFYRINLIPYDERPKHHPSGEDGIYPENRVCEDMGDALEVYTSDEYDAGDVIDLVSDTCTPNKTWKILSKNVRTVLGKERYKFTMMPLISTATAVVFIFIFLSFTIDVAIRAIKLAVLRLIAPIPIISYMDPKGSKDSAFNSWVKLLTTTYLDLFIRLATIYFVLFIIQEMIKNGVGFGYNGTLRIFSRLAIWIGLLSFAKQAPKFIKQALGIKDDGEGKGIFSGFGQIGAAVGMGAAFVGGIGAARASARASRLADETNFGKDKANSLLNRGKHLLAGITGGVGGVSAGLSAAMGAKDHTARAVFDAQRKHAATVIGQGADGSTAAGRFKDRFEKMWQGDTQYDKDTREIAANEAKSSAGKNLFEYVEGKAKTKGGAYELSANGEAITLNEFYRRKAEADARRKQFDKDGNPLGDGTFTVGTQTYHVDSDVVGELEKDLVSQAGSQYIANNFGKKDADGHSLDEALDKRMGVYTDVGGVSHDMGDIKKFYKTAETAASTKKSSKEYQRAKANRGANDKK